MYSTFDANKYLNSSLRKNLCFAAYIICMAVTIYVMPIVYIYDSNLKGYDLGDTVMGLYFFAVPLHLAILVFLYSLTAGNYKRTIGFLALMLLPTVLILGVMDGTVIEVIYDLGGMAIGAVGWLMHWAIADKMDKADKKKEKTAEAEKEK